MSRFTIGLAALVATLVLANPGLAASAHPGKPVTGATGQSGARGPAVKGKAYGYYCRGLSNVHVAGQKGTPFSQCVTAMAKLAAGKASSPQVACSSVSKAHAPGEKGTPYSRCVAAGAKLLKDRRG